MLEYWGAGTERSPTHLAECSAAAHLATSFPSIPLTPLLHHSITPIFRLPTRERSENDSRCETCQMETALVIQGDRTANQRELPLKCTIKTLGKSSRSCVLVIQTKKDVAFHVSACPRAGSKAGCVPSRECICRRGAGKTCGTRRGHGLCLLRLLILAARWSTAVGAMCPYAPSTSAVVPNKAGVSARPFRTTRPGMLFATVLFRNPSAATSA